MTLKNLLVHIDDGKACNDRIRGAIVLAQAHGAHCPGTRISELIGLHARYADMVVLGQAAHGGELGDHIAEDVMLSSERPALVVPFIGADQSIRPALGLAPS